MKTLSKRLAEAKAKQAVRLEKLYEAIREGRAYLKTSHQGYRLVVGYTADGWAITNNTGGSLDRSSYMVCDTDILIAPAPIIQERPVVKRYTFLFNGRECEAVSYEIERTYSWPK